MKIISSEKKFVEKVKEGFKLETHRKFKRILYFLTNYKNSEITVSKSLIERLENKGVIDRNYDIHLQCNEKI